MSGEKVGKGDARHTGTLLPVGATIDTKTAMVTRPPDSPVGSSSARTSIISPPTEEPRRMHHVVSPSACPPHRRDDVWTRHNQPDPEHPPSADTTPLARTDVAVQPHPRPAGARNGGSLRTALKDLGRHHAESRRGERSATPSTIADHRDDEQIRAATGRGRHDDHSPQPKSDTLHAQTGEAPENLIYGDVGEPPVPPVPPERGHKASDDEPLRYFPPGHRERLAAIYEERDAVLEQLKAAEAEPEEVQEARMRFAKPIGEAYREANRFLREELAPPLSVAPSEDQYTTVNEKTADEEREIRAPFTSDEISAIKEVREILEGEDGIIKRGMGGKYPERDIWFATMHFPRQRISRENPSLTDRSRAVFGILYLAATVEDILIPPSENQRQILEPTTEAELRKIADLPQKLIRHNPTEPNGSPNPDPDSPSPGRPHGSEQPEQSTHLSQTAGQKEIDTNVLHVLEELPSQLRETLVNSGLFSDAYRVTTEVNGEQVMISSYYTALDLSYSKRPGGNSTHMELQRQALGEGWGTVETTFTCSPGEVSEDGREVSSYSYMSVLPRELVSFYLQHELATVLGVSYETLHDAEEEMGRLLDRKGAWVGLLDKEEELKAFLAGTSNPQAVLRINNVVAALLNSKNTLRDPDTQNHLQLTPALLGDALGRTEVDLDEPVIIAITHFASKAEGNDIEVLTEASPGHHFDRLQLLSTRLRTSRDVTDVVQAENAEVTTTPPSHGSKLKSAVEYIEGAIENGEFPPGSKLDWDAIAARTQVRPRTITRAREVLLRSGKITTIRGIGSFVGMEVPLEFRGQSLQASVRPEKAPETKAAEKEELRQRIRELLAEDAERASNAPRIQEVKKWLIDEFTAGRLDVYDKLSVKAINRALSIAEGTIRKAFDELHDNHILEKRVGIGTFLGKMPEDYKRPSIQRERTKRKRDRIMDAVEQRIAKGIYNSNDELPLDALAQEFGLSLRTVRRVTKDLEELGVVVGGYGHRVRIR